MGMTKDERFWSKTETSEHHDCWNWDACTDRGGYGNFSDKGKMRIAHRVAWELSKGDIPEGLCILHKCDNRRCCNPLHLFLGTYLDNNRDRARKNRNNHALGEAHGLSRLTESAVRQIRELYGTDGHTSVTLAKVFSVSKDAVMSAIRRKTWRHLP